ncbi:gtp-binding protein [Cystoisospora suis]|uniref:Gtp-binding protein n=1 Tax=Cystoisospora suis TaxID=483139 RepID=A0A2C6LCY6_9APIC|nr:gtp-binding protein [Cystoisospora suis]
MHEVVRQNLLPSSLPLFSPSSFSPFQPPCSSSSSHLSQTLQASLSSSSLVNPFLSSFGDKNAFFSSFFKKIDFLSTKQSSLSFSHRSFHSPLTSTRSPLSSSLSSSFSGSHSSSFTSSSSVSSVSSSLLLRPDRPPSSSSSFSLSRSSSSLASSNSQRLSPMHSIAGLASPVQTRSPLNKEKKRKKQKKGNGRATQTSPKKKKKRKSSSEEKGKMATQKRRRKAFHTTQVRRNPHLPLPRPLAPSSSSCPSSRTKKKGKPIKGKEEEKAKRISPLLHTESPIVSKKEKSSSSSLSSSSLSSSFPSSLLSSSPFPLPHFSSPPPIGMPLHAAIGILRGGSRVKICEKIHPSIIGGTTFLGSFAIPSDLEKSLSLRQGEASEKMKSYQHDKRKKKPSKDRDRRMELSDSSVWTAKERRAAWIASQDKARSEGTEGEDEGEYTREGEQVIHIPPRDTLHYSPGRDPYTGKEEKEEDHDDDDEEEEREGKEEEEESDQRELTTSSFSSSSLSTRLSLRSKLLERLLLPCLGLPEVALLGRSNVGKSSLLNAMCTYTRIRHRGRGSETVLSSQKRLFDQARVSKRPGSTRSINLYQVWTRSLPAISSSSSRARKRRKRRMQIISTSKKKKKKNTKSEVVREGRTVFSQRSPHLETKEEEEKKKMMMRRRRQLRQASQRRGVLVLADLPGYGTTKGLSKDHGKELSKNVRLYVEKRNELRLFLLLVDGRIGLRDLDADLLAWLIEQEIPTLLVVTKADKMNRQHFENLVDQFSFYPKLLSLPSCMQRFKALRPEPKVVERHQYVSPALLAAARTSSDNDKSTKYQQEEEEEKEQERGLEEKKGEAGSRERGENEEKIAEGRRGDGTVVSSEGVGAPLPSGVHTPELYTLASSDKRVGVLHGLEGQEGEKIRQEEEEKKERAEIYHLRGLETFQASSLSKRNISREGQAEEEEEEGRIEVILTSAATGQGIAEVWRFICEACSAKGTRENMYVEEAEEKENGDEDTAERWSDTREEERDSKGDERMSSVMREGEEEENRQDRKDRQSSADGIDDKKKKKNRRKTDRDEYNYEDPFWGFGL